MDARRRDYLHINLNYKDTDELLEIWKTHDEKEWTGEAFEVIGEILQDRGVELPPHDEPGALSGERRFSAEVDAITDIGELERRIAEVEAQLVKVRSQRAATLAVAIVGSASLIFCGLSRTLEAGLYGIVFAAAALVLFVGLNAWRIARDAERERNLEAELDEYRDKKAQLEALLTEEE